MARQFDHGLVVGQFAPPHQGDQLLIEAAMRESLRVTILVWSNPDYPEMPSWERASWLQELYPDAEVFAPEDPPRDDRPEVVHREFVRLWLAARGIRADVVFSSESYGPGLAAHLCVEHRFVNLARMSVPVSGTAVRADVHAARGFLDPRIYRNFVRRIVFMGAESTGKSTLARRMAQEMKTEAVEESGRTLYEEHEANLELNYYLSIARRHLALEDEAILRADRDLFVDTNAITTMFFSHYYNGDSLPELRELANGCKLRYHEVFVCDDDIPFVRDGRRDNAVWRGRMQGMVLYDLAVREIPFTLVSGSLEERVERVKAVLAAEPVALTTRPRRAIGSSMPGLKGCDPL